MSVPYLSVLFQLFCFFVSSKSSKMRDNEDCRQCYKENGFQQRTQLLYVAKKLDLWIWRHPSTYSKDRNSLDKILNWLSKVDVQYDQFSQSGQLQNENDW
jgi:hypothetical protein